VKKSSFTLKVNNPCTENWDEMTPADKGRHCAACQKTVIDFTTLTDKEIISFFADYTNDRVCGHFLVSQVDRELTILKPNQSFSIKPAQRIAASLLLLQTIATTAWSQDEKPRTEQQDNTFQASGKNQLLKGIVMDYVTKAPLSGMTVRITGTELVAATDKHGKYKFTLPDSLQSKALKLTAFYSDSGLAPDGTVILDIDANADALSRSQDQVIYRYPSENLTPFINEDYKKPIVTRDHYETTLTGLVSDRVNAAPTGMYQQQRGADVAPPVPVTDVKVGKPAKKKTFWQRITAQFHKKKHQDD